MKNMTDERFEICSLIWRFYPIQCGHNEKDTEYQLKLEDTFSSFASHPAAQYALNLEIGFDAVGHFAMHLEKRGDTFALVEDLQRLFECGRWNRERAEGFIPLLNNFYKDTNFGQFYVNHMPLYEKITQKFVAQTYSQVDFKWFEKYMDTSSLHFIVSPSLSRCNYGADGWDGFYTILPPGDNAVIHEICHRFGNPLAEKWYDENPNFRKLCDDTAKNSKLSYYSACITYAREYITRAYDVLYDIQHGEADLDARIACERDSNVENSFPYMHEIYKMVLLKESSVASDIAPDFVRSG